MIGVQIAWPSLFGFFKHLPELARVPYYMHGIRVGLCVRKKVKYIVC